MRLLSIPSITGSAVGRITPDPVRVLQRIGSRLAMVLAAVIAFGRSRSRAASFALRQIPRSSRKMTGNAQDTTNRRVPRVWNWFSESPERPMVTPFGRCGMISPAISFGPYFAEIATSQKLSAAMPLVPTISLS